MLCSSCRVSAAVKPLWRSCSPSTRSVTCCYMAPTRSTGSNWITANWLVRFTSYWLCLESSKSNFKGFRVKEIILLSTKRPLNSIPAKWVHAVLIMPVRTSQICIWQRTWVLNRVMTKWINFIQTSKGWFDRAEERWSTIAVKTEFVRSCLEASAVEKWWKDFKEIKNIKWRSGMYKSFEGLNC